MLNKILNFQKPFTTFKWGVMYMTFKAKFYFMIQGNKSLKNQHFFIQFEIRIIFQKKMQNLVEFIHLQEKKKSYSSKVNTKNVRY